MDDNGEDLAQQKMQAILNNGDFSITHASGKFDISQNSKASLKATLDSLPQGVHLIRDIKPLNNEKLEDYGHSMILMKHRLGYFFYDPNLGVEYIKNEGISNRIFENLAMNYARFKVSETRFYQMEKKKSESQSLSHLSPLEIKKLPEAARARKALAVPRGNEPFVVKGVNGMKGMNFSFAK